MADEFVKVASRGELTDGEMTLVTVGDEEVLLANVGGEIFAIANDCTHSFGPLNAGSLEGDEVECPLHGSRFNVRQASRPKAPLSVARRSFRCEWTGTMCWWVLLRWGLGSPHPDKTMADRRFGCSCVRFRLLARAGPCALAHSIAIRPPEAQTGAPA